MHFIYVLIFVSIYLSCVFAEFVLVESGVEPPRRGNVAMIFYVTAQNTCTKSYKVKINMKQCCENITEEEPDCATMQLVGGDMGILQSGETKNLSYIYPTLYPLNRVGACTVAVWYSFNNEEPRHLETTIPFNTLVKGRKNKLPAILKDYSMLHLKRCEHMDEDPQDDCLPVNCLMKYRGTRSYYNLEKKKCERTPECRADTNKTLPDFVYDPTSNMCRNMENDMSAEDVKFLTGATGAGCGDEMKSEDMPHLKNMRCHHGALDVKSGFCVCDDGWTSSPVDPESFDPSMTPYHMCTIQLPCGLHSTLMKWQTGGIAGIAILGVCFAMFVVCCSVFAVAMCEFLTDRNSGTDVCSCPGGFDDSNTDGLYTEATVGCCCDAYDASQKKSSSTLMGKVVELQSDGEGGKPGSGGDASGRELGQHTTVEARHFRYEPAEPFTSNQAMGTGSESTTYTLQLPPDAYLSDDTLPRLPQRPSNRSFTPPEYEDLRPRRTDTKTRVAYMAQNVNSRTAFNDSRTAFITPKRSPIPVYNIPLDSDGVRGRRGAVPSSTLYLPARDISASMQSVDEYVDAVSDDVEEKIGERWPEYQK